MSDGDSCRHATRTAFHPQGLRFGYRPRQSDPVPYSSGQLLDETAITVVRERIFMRIAEYFANRTGVLGIFVCGSMADESADAASDIDVRVVVTPETFDEFCSNRHAAPESWGELLFNSGSMAPSMRVSHFRPIVKVDVFYYRPEDLRPSPWFTLPVKVLLDRDHSIMRLLEQSAGMTFSAPPEAVNETINQLLACTHEILRRVHRGELAYAQTILNEMRQLMIAADEHLGKRPPYGFSHFESECGDPALLDLIRKSYCGYESEPILRVAHRLATHFAKQLSRLNNAFALQRNDARDAAALRVILDLGRPPE